MPFPSRSLTWTLYFSASTPSRKTKQVKDRWCFLERIKRQARWQIETHEARVLWTVPCGPWRFTSAVEHGFLSFLLPRLLHIPWALMSASLSNLIQKKGRRVKTVQFEGAGSRRKKKRKQTQFNKGKGKLMLVKSARLRVLHYARWMLGVHGCIRSIEHQSLSDSKLSTVLW